MAQEPKHKMHKMRKLKVANVALQLKELLGSDIEF